MVPAIFNIRNTFPKNQQLQNRELETPSQESTTQEQRMIMATIKLFPGEEYCDTLHMTGQLWGESKFNLQYPMLETQLKFEYVENLHLTTILSGEGTVANLEMCH